MKTKRILRKRNFPLTFNFHFPQVKAVEKIAQTYNDQTTDNINVRSISNNPIKLTWTNTSLTNPRSSMCPMDELMAVQEVSGCSSITFLSIAFERFWDNKFLNFARLWDDDFFELTITTVEFKMISIIFPQLVARCRVCFLITSIHSNFIWSLITFVLVSL